MEWHIFPQKKPGNISQLIKKTWTGKRHEIYTYRYVNDVPIRDGEKALHVNWCELSINLTDGTRVYHNSFITDHRLDDKSVIAVVKAGRTRWKIENENNNTLKTKGYHFEHNFGHGKQYLASLLATLIILAFLLHTVLELFDEKFKVLRKKLASRKRLFNDVAALTTYFCFDDWKALLQFMIEGLEKRHQLSEFLK